MRDKGKEYIERAIAACKTPEAVRAAREMKTFQNLPRTQQLKEILLVREVANDAWENEQGIGRVSQTAALTALEQKLTHWLGPVTEVDQVMFTYLQDLQERDERKRRV